jgi:hypothetical protein
MESPKPITNDDYHLLASVASHPRQSDSAVVDIGTFFVPSDEFYLNTNVGTSIRAVMSSPQNL